MTEEIPAWKLTFEVALVAASREEALEWAADQLEAICNAGETLGGGAEVAWDPITFLEEVEE